MAEVPDDLLYTAEHEWVRVSEEPVSITRRARSESSRYPESTASNRPPIVGVGLLGS